MKKSFEVTFQNWFSKGSVPSWKLENEGPSERLREKPRRILNLDSGKRVRFASYMRRAICIWWGEKGTGILGVEMGGFKGLASKL